MKLTTVFLLSLCLQLSARTMGQSVTFAGKNVLLTDVFKAIKQQTGFVVFFQKGTLNESKRVSLAVKAVSVEAVLQQVLDQQSLTWSLEDKTIFIKPRSVTSPVVPGATQATGITGTVTDEKGAPLAGVSVMVKGTNHRTATNDQGHFRLPGADATDAVLVFTMVGYEKSEIAAKGNRTLTVRLRLSVAKIVEVEVTGNTGYQNIPRERATGAFDVVTSKQLSNRVQTNVLERLEGQVPGLMLLNGKDNGSASGDGLTIRGVSTLYGTKRPLIVIDNFPFDGALDAINPNDVASITILKDAAAASIWGARAANGVIVITTRTAKQGKIQFTYNNNFQFEPKPNLGYLNRLDATEDIAINRLLANPNIETYARNSGGAFSAFERFYMDSVAKRITPAQYAAAVDSLGRLDNSQQIRDLLMQAPLTQNHSLSFMGGNEKNNYYGSLRLTDTRGYALKDRTKNYSFLLKDNYNVSSKLSFSVSANLTYTDATATPLDPVEIYRLKPYSMLQDAQGQPLAVNRNSDPANQNNSNDFTIGQRLAWGLGDESFYPLKQLNLIENTTNSVYNRLQAAIKYSIIPGIDINLSYQLENGSSYNKIFTHRDEPTLIKEVNDFIVPQRDGNGNIVTNADGTLAGPTFNLPQGGKIKETRSNFSSYLLRGLINVNKDIRGDHNIAAVAGVERRQSKATGSYFTKYGYDDNSLQFVDIDIQRLKTISGTLQAIQNGFSGLEDGYSYRLDRFVSAFGNAAYTFRRKYVASGSIRMDATNLFGTDPKYLYRPMWSGGVSWIASNEAFIQRLSFLDYLQVRATYGINGNIPKNSGPFMIATNGTNYFTNLPYNSITTPANNQLRWEKTTVTNIGIDFTLWHNRLSGKADYYVRKSTDLLGDQDINPTLGFTSASINTASMNNTGWELQLMSQNIKTQEFEWSTTFTYAHNKSKITKVALSSDVLTPSAIASRSPFIQGDPYGSLYSFRYGGLTPDKGQIQLLDATGKIAPDKYYYDLNMVYYSGTTRPVNTGALSNNFAYKGFDLNFMFVFYLGHVKRQAMPQVYRGVNSFDKRLKDAWKQPGDEGRTNIPNVILDNSAYYASVYYGSYLDVNVFDAGYIKLRDVTLRYTFSPKTVSKWKMVRGLQLTANARNLWTITRNDLGIDPEAFDGRNRTMPVMPSYSFGVNLDF
nr:SusC/RagA family TonB-linked outer membrane protein [uncultured Chitinophaga sp.]